MAYTLSVLIPCYNEAPTIEKLITSVARAPIDNIEIIVVDDGSTDGTSDILDKFTEKQVHTILKHAENRGKGAAIRTGLKHASGDYVIIQDADMEYDPGEYPKLLKPILENGADVVYGSRFLGAEAHRVLFFWHFLGNKVLTLLCNLFSDLNLTDMETCYKLFKRELIQNVTLKENRFGFEPEITLKIARIPDICIYEISVAYFGRSYAEGKKIRWKDGVRALYCILKYGAFRSN